MKKQIINALATAALFTAAIGCTKETVKMVEVPGKPTAMEGQEPTVVIKSNATAEELALAGEQLISFYSFQLASSVFDKALELEPTNKRALFYKDIIRPLMKGHGVLTRMKLTEEMEANAAVSVAEMPNTPLKSFLTDTSVKEIRTDVEAQDYLVEVRDAFIESSRSLKQKLDWELTLNINPYLIDSMSGDGYDYLNTCTSYPYTDQNGQTVEQIYCQDIAVERKKEVDHYTRKVSTADFLAIQQYYAGIVFFMIPYTAWSVEGYSELEKMTDLQTIDYATLRTLMNTKQNLLTLRKDHALNFIPEMGANAIAASKWALKYQDRICPHGKKFEGRKGHLLQDGICIFGPERTKLQDSISLVETILGGRTTQKIGNPGRMMTTDIDVTALWKNPITDLKTLIVENPDACAPEKRFENTTLNGVFPKGDLNEVSKLDCP